MNANDIFPEDWVTAQKLPDQDVHLTIERFCYETLNDGTEKPCLFFKETDKGLVLNKTNKNTVQKLHGDETDDWAGKMISLFKMEVPFRGEMVWGTRIRLTTPEKTNVQPTPEPEPVPFV